MLPAFLASMLAQSMRPVFHSSVSPSEIQLSISTIEIRFRKGYLPHSLFSLVLYPGPEACLCVWAKTLVPIEL